MTRMRRGNKQSVRYRQFQGRYAQVEATQLQALLEGYRQGIFRRNEVRVFAGMLEEKSLHEDSAVTLYRVINCRSTDKGNRHLSRREIDAAAAKLKEHLPMMKNQVESRSPRDERRVPRKPVARRVLRYIARGEATTVEALFCFAYFLRRISQRKPMQRLQAEEHYARFRYAEFEAWTGVHRGTQSRVLKRLKIEGFLNTVPVHKQNENAYGQLFIDGEMLTLVRPRQTVRLRSTASAQRPELRLEKKSTHLGKSSNTPRRKKSTLRNLDPKREIEKEKGLAQRLKSGVLAGHPNAEMRRIALRAAQMVGVEMQQAA